MGGGARARGGKRNGVIDMSLLIYASAIVLLAMVIEDMRGG